MGWHCWGKLAAPLPHCLQQGPGAWRLLQGALLFPSRPSFLRGFCGCSMSAEMSSAPLSTPYPGPFGTHSASRNSPGRGKGNIPKIALPFNPTPGRVPIVAPRGGGSAVSLGSPTPK